MEQSAPAIRRIVKLLINSFHPANKENDDLVRILAITLCNALKHEVYKMKIIRLNENIEIPFYCSVKEATMRFSVLVRISKILNNIYKEVQFT